MKNVKSTYHILILSASFALIGVVIVCSCISGEDEARTVKFPPSHPRLALSADELDALRKNPDTENKRKDIISKADKMLAEILFVPKTEGQWIFYYACPKDGTRLEPESAETHVCPKCKVKYTDKRIVAAYVTIQYGKLENQMQDLATAFAVTGDDKYAAPIKDAFLELAKLYPTLQRHDRWGRTGILAVVGGRRYSQHLDEAYSAIRLAKTYDLCAASGIFSPDDRTRIEQDFLGATVREIQRYELFVGRKNNHQTWFNAAYANVGVAIGDEKLVNDSLYGSGGLLWQLDNSVTSDGIWYEGTMSYHFYALMAITEQLKALRHVGIDLSGNQRLKSLWSGPLSLVFPDGSIPPIHDGDPFVLTQRKDIYAFAGEYFKDSLFANFAEGKSSEKELASQDLSGIGIAILREGKEAAAKCAMMDYGIHGDHHGHPDKLNLLVWALGLEIFPDIGRISYSVPEYETWTRTTAAHNTVAIDCKNQSPDTGKLLFFESKPGYSASFAKSDGAYSGYELSRFLLLTDKVLVDIFKVQGSSKALIDSFLHTRGELAHINSVEPKKIAGLGDKNGYQHLAEAREYPTAEYNAFTLALKDGRLVRIHLPDDKEGKLYSGIGIGSQLTEKVPFILRRREASSTVFVACYDLSGDGSAVDSVKILPVSGKDGNALLHTEAVGLEIKNKDVTSLMAFDLDEETPSGLSFQGNKFERLLFLNLQK